VPFLPHARDTIVRDQARRLLYVEPLKNRLLRRDVERQEIEGFNRVFSLQSPKD
jgi:hypothetical protein